MNESTPAPKLDLRTTLYLLRHLWQMMLFLPLLAGVVVYFVWTTGLSNADANATLAATDVISLKTLEDRFGMRIRLIGVTAAGGMIDLRYKVLDSTKAEYLVGEGVEIKLVAEDSGTVLVSDSHGMKHNGRLVDGSIYLHMYANAGNAIKPGTPVSILFGSTKLEPIVAQ